MLWTWYKTSYKTIKVEKNVFFWKLLYISINFCIYENVDFELVDNVGIINVSSIPIFNGEFGAINLPYGYIIKFIGLNVGFFFEIFQSGISSWKFENQRALWKILHM
jgi:hypothetical protein